MACSILKVALEAAKQLTFYMCLSVGNIASMRRRQHAVSVGKERREALVRTKRFCRDGFVEKCDSSDREMIIDEEQAELDAQTTRTVEELKSSVLYQYISFPNLFLCWLLVSILCN